MKQCEILHLKDLYKKSAIMILFTIKQEEMPDILLDCASWAEEDSQTHTLNKFTRKIWDDTWHNRKDEWTDFHLLLPNRPKQEKRHFSLLTKSQIGLEFEQ